MLRDYQQDAHNAAIDWARKYVDPCLLELPTGAGKSHVIAAIAETLHRISHGKHILCLQPSKELLEQNSAKYPNDYSLFSASVGSKCLKYPVVFATEKSVINKLHRFGNQFCAVILDEAHRITPTIKTIIESMRVENPRLRVIGLSATPYRLQTGYIYKTDERGQATGHDGYFMRRVYSLSARYLIDNGYLTEPVIGAINDHYDTLDMEVNKLGQFNKADVDRAYHGQGRLTSRIVADIVGKSSNRHGVMIFAATVQHAYEVLESLPSELSAIVTGNTPKKERELILARFKARLVKYIVNVSVLTTGFDAPHIDVVAILRATESASLLQQIIGRGLRISDNKQNCIVLDYAQNIERHCPDGDLFNPEIEVAKVKGEAEPIDVLCPTCKQNNKFAAKPNPDGLEINLYGYFLDLEGKHIETDYGPEPAHFGRRCNGWTALHGTFQRCDYRWTFKPCLHCEVENDIAARYCASCKGELIDPNEKLVADFVAHKKDPTQVQVDRLVSLTSTPTVSLKGNECVMLSIVTPHRSFKSWLVIGSAQHRKFMALPELPATITYCKKKDFYNILAYNEAEDEIPRMA